MSDDFRRRRRLSNTGSPRRRGGGGNGINPWIITIFAALVVVAGGWFLGQALAHVFNGQQKPQQVAQAPTPVPVVTPLPSSSPAATRAPSATAAPTPSPKPKPTPEPSPTATVKVTTAPSETPAPTPTTARTATPVPTATGSPTTVPSAPPAQRHTQPVGRRPEPTAAPSDDAAGPTRVVRSYIDALRRSDPSTAQSYLANGAPDESFIDSATRISNITSTRNSDGSYKVSVDLQTSKGEYYETFTVASDRILEKTAIKP